MRLMEEATVRGGGVDSSAGVGEAQRESRVTVALVVRGAAAVNGSLRMPSRAEVPAEGKRGAIRREGWSDMQMQVERGEGARTACTASHSCSRLPQSEHSRRYSLTSVSLHGARCS